MIVDIEESCVRLGLDIVAIVKNVEGPDYALSRERVVTADDLDPDLKLCPYVTPFFTPANRLAAHNDAVARGFTREATIIDPAAVVASSTTIGPGSYVNCGAVIGAAARIGAFVFINRSANLGHHVEIDDFASIGPGVTICGGARLQRGAVVGAGAIVLENVEIGRNAVVGAGAVVRESVADHCLVAGNPARIIDPAYAGFRNLSV
jgi:sugar O-acyltransferase (sialic acid O-acetyltransferase NeuD family)